MAKFPTDAPRQRVIATLERLGFQLVRAKEHNEVMSIPRQLEKARKPSLVREIGSALRRLDTLVAAVKRPGDEGSKYDKALAVLGTLSRKEGIPIAIVGGLAAIKHGYERNTKDIDVVVSKRHLDSIVRVAPNYGVKVIWHAPNGWHKLSCEGVAIDIAPEGGKPSRNASTTIPGPRELGVQRGMDYASLEGWVLTKLISGRRQDQADVVQVLKQIGPESSGKVRRSLAGSHRIYLRLFDDLCAAAEEEREQERERGGPR